MPILNFMGSPASEDILTTARYIKLRIKKALLRNEIQSEDLNLIDEGLEIFYSACNEIQSFIIDTHPIVHNNIKKSIPMLIEGAQGTLLDIDHGTFPFVTSSNCSSAGIGTGLGIPTNNLNKIIGIFKAYVTRVGGGPFPTELFDSNGEELQNKGKEFGATTGRARRYPS